MSQISPPIRILLVLTVAFLGVYMLFLRPNDEVAPPPTPTPAPNVKTSKPAVSAPGKVVERAQGAVADANKQIEKAADAVDGGEAAAGTASRAGKAGATASAAARPAVDVKGLPKPVARAIRRHKTLVLLFWNGRSADDRAVHAALKKVDRWNGRVFVDAVPIVKISKYGRIARGVDVEQSPTVVVADSKLRAETLVGYVDAQTINQAVVDAFRNTGGIYTSAYLAKIDKVCARASSHLWAIPDPDNARQATTSLATGRAHWRRFESAFKAIPAPQRFRALKRATAADNAAATAVLSEWIAYLGSKPSTARLVASIGRYGPRWKAIGRRYSHRMDGAHVLSCGTSA